MPDYADSPSRITDFPRWWLIAAGGALLLLLALANLEMAGITLNQHFQVMLLLIGGLLAAYGAGGWPSFTLDKAQLWPLLAITLLAFALRLWGLGTLVSTPVADEYAFADTAIALWDKNDFPLLEPFDDGYAFTWLHPYLMLFSMELFGWDVFSLRLPAAFLGALTIPTLYWLVSILFDRRLAWMAALLLATFPPHIHLSRMALNNIADPFFGTLALALLARGLRTHNRADFAWAGFALGFTQFFYEGGRLLFPALAFVFVLTYSIPGGFKRLRDARRALLAGTLVFVMLALPFYVTLVDRGYPFAPRLGMVAPGADRFPDIAARTDPKNILPASYFERVAGVLLHFVYRLDNSPDFYGGPQPMILTALVPLFAFGLWHLLRRWRDPGSRLMMLWLLLAVGGISLIRIGAWTARYAVIFPALAVVLACGANYTAEALRRFPHSRRVLAGVVLLAAGWQVVYYFGPHLDMYSRQVRPFLDYADAYQRAGAYPPDAAVYFITDDVVWEPYIRILGRLWRRDPAVTITSPQDLPGLLETFAAPPDDPILFFIPRDAATAAALVDSLLVDGPAFSPFNVPPDRQYALYYWPPD